MFRLKLKKLFVWICVAVIFLFGTLILGPAKTQANEPSGWDYNLTKKCVKSTNSSAANYFGDLSGCDGSGKNWTVAVQSEKTYAAGSCPGPTNQSFPINSAGSPLSMNWQAHTDELGRSNWSINLKTDLSANSHPCGSGYFTWFVLMDHAGHGGGPFPRPDQLSFSATVNFSDYVPNGATRGFVAWQGSWDGKARGIELTFQGTNWGDNYPNEPDIVDYLNTSSLEFVHMDGRALGISAPKEVDTKLNIDWTNIIKNLVSRGYLQAPSTGWENTVTTDVHVGHESHNWAASQSVISSLWVTNFRVENTASPPPDTAVPSTPTNLSAGAISSTQINLSWSPSTDNVGVTGYRVYRGGTQIATMSGTSYQNTELNPSATYSYAVAAYDAAGNVSAQSAPASAITAAPPDTTPPTISSIAASGITSSGATITWATNEPADTQVEYGLTANYGQTTGLNPSLVSAHSVSLSGLGASTLYHYRVKSKDASGNLAVSADQTFTTAAIPDTAPPPSASNFRAQPGDSQIALSWQNPNSSDWVKTRAVRKTGSAPSSPTDGVVVYEGTAQSTVDTNLTNGQLYYYGAFTADAASNYSNPVTVSAAPQGITPPPPPDTQAPSAPTGPTASTAPCSQVYLSWTASTDSVGVVGYRVYRNGTQIVSVTSTSYQDSGLSPQTYSYTVSAYDAAGNVSAQSATVSVATCKDPPPLPAFPYPDGTLFKYPNDPAVYILEQNSKRPIPSYNILLRNYAGRPVLTLDFIPYGTGNPVKFASGALLKSPNNPAVYLILGDGSKYGFRSEEEFTRFGCRFDLVDIIPDNELASYPLSEATNLLYHSNNTFIKYPNSATVYRIDNNTKRGIPSSAVFLSYAKEFGRVLIIDQSFQYPAGPILGFPDGTLIKGSDPTVYLISSGQRRPFISSSTFQSMGYNFAAVRRASESDLLLHPLGQEIK